MERKLLHSHMTGVFTFLAPVAMLFPAPLAVDTGALDQDVVRLDPQVASRTATGMSEKNPVQLKLDNALPVQRQVRIQQRVIVRISPRPTANRQSLVADAQPVPRQPRYEERKMEKCIPVGGIAGVQTGSGNRLLLFLKDRRVVTANLEKSCRARDFYSGFYLERNKDGKLCVDRDKLQSRSGANCEIERMRQLVSVSE